MGGVVVEAPRRAASARRSRRCSGVRSPRTYGSHTGRSPGSTVEHLVRVAPIRASAAPARGTGRPALLGPPMRVLPAAECGMVHSPGTSTQSSSTPQVMSVVPHSTSTSPVSSAPATSCSANASMVPPADEGARPGELVAHLTGGLDARTRCRAGVAGVVPASSASTASQPVKSNSGWAVIAVVESIAPRPQSAWLATAWAGQYPAASGAVRRLPGEEGEQLAAVARPGSASWPARSPRRSP